MWNKFNDAINDPTKTYIYATGWYAVWMIFFMILGVLLSVSILINAIF